MNLEVLLTFGIAIGAYLICLGLWVLWKRHRLKKKHNKEVDKNEGTNNGEETK